jgi:hypothetical protein
VVRPSRLHHAGETPAPQLILGQPLGLPRTKKADVAGHPKVFRHVGLLANKPPGMAGLLFI